MARRFSRDPSPRERRIVYAVLFKKPRFTPRPRLYAFHQILVTKLCVYQVAFIFYWA